MSSKHAAHKGTIGKLNSQILKNLRISASGKNTKTPKQLERHLKGVANHRRIEILMLVNRRQGITVDQIAETLHCNFKTISAHTQKLVQSGLLEKKYLGHNVLHTLSPYGKKFNYFLISF
jgi:DNA-binding MarR family transcriptional regulator